MRSWETRLGLNLKELMRKTKTTPSEIVRETGVPRATFFRWLNHESKPVLGEEILALAKFFSRKIGKEITVDQLCLKEMPDFGKVKDRSRVQKYPKKNEKVPLQLDIFKVMRF